MLRFLVHLGQGRECMPRLLESFQQPLGVAELVDAHRAHACQREALVGRRAPSLCLVAEGAMARACERRQWCQVT